MSDRNQKLLLSLAHCELDVMRVRIAGYITSIENMKMAMAADIVGIDRITKRIENLNLEDLKEAKAQ